MRDLRRQCIGLLLTAVLLEACGPGGGTPSSPPTYTVGGVLTGVSGSGLTLELNGATDLTLAANVCSLECDRIHRQRQYHQRIPCLY